MIEDGWGEARPSEEDLNVDLEEVDQGQTMPLQRLPARLRKRVRDDANVLSDSNKIIEKSVRVSKKKNQEISREVV
ncbi:MAG: hypothetical protein OXE58_07965 [Acidobacteria bacterium]|nr:hypothetical protein [Acidobacteriota bacterium]